jgi:hypothetical protein
MLPQAAAAPTHLAHQPPLLLLLLSQHHHQQQQHAAQVTAVLWVAQLRSQAAVAAAQLALETPAHPAAP